MQKLSRTLLLPTPCGWGGGAATVPRASRRHRHRSTRPSAHRRDAQQCLTGLSRHQYQHNRARPPSELLSARPCRDGLTGTRQLDGLAGVPDVTTHAPLRSPWTKAPSVCHVRGLGDGEAPTSLTKDTRLAGVACSAWFGHHPRPAVTSLCTRKGRTRHTSHCGRRTGSRS